METPRLQITITAMLVVVACVAVNIWLFRVGIIWGFLGLNVTKHIVIAQLCHKVGLNRSDPPPPPPGMSPAARAEPSSN